MLRQLVLIPTQLEQQYATELDAMRCDSVSVELCGIGAIAAAARTAALISNWRPQAVLLVGIAGVLDSSPLSKTSPTIGESLEMPRVTPGIPSGRGAEPRHADDSGLRIGQAYEFDSVACYGIGAGSGSEFQTLQEMNWQHWPSPRIGDCIDLHMPTIGPSSGAGQLLSVCAVSATPAEATQHRQKFPAARAEDMEGFSVAIACRMGGVPLRIVRGISNIAGDRNQQSWRVRDAMSSASQLARQILQQSRS